MCRGSYINILRKWCTPKEEEKMILKNKKEYARGDHL
jgi:hypothetical protein